MDRESGVRACLSISNDTMWKCQETGIYIGTKKVGRDKVDAPSSKQ